MTPHSWWLTTLFSIAALVAGTAHAEGGHEYVGAVKCKTCHRKELIGNQYATWLENPHHGAFTTLRSERSAAIARDRGLAGAAHEAAECLRCHATAQGVPAERMAYDLRLTDGVQCESCHGPGRDYRKKKIMSDPEEAAAKGLWDAENDASLCERCHNAESPTFDPERYSLPDGTTSGFDFPQAKARIAHPIPEHVKGKYVELEEEEKRRKKAAE